MDFSRIFASIVALSPRALVLTLIAAGVLLFLPTAMLVQLGVDDIRAQFRPWIGLTAIVCTSLLLTHFVFFLFQFGRKKYVAAKSMRIYEQRLHELSSEEVTILRDYIVRGSKTLVLDPTSGVVGGLETAKIIYKSSNLGSIMGWAYNLQPWAWRYLNANQELLMTQEELQDWLREKREEWSKLMEDSTFALPIRSRRVAPSNNN